tara:strand:- start:1940 stop:2599 length:660 start_codon:yes stop_codon:yes gene_type:complete
MKKLLLVLLLPIALFAREPKDVLQESKQVAKSIREDKVEEALLIHHWLSYTQEIAIHQQRGAKGNRVYLGPEGQKEAVYDSEGKLVQDGINDGSYNYAHPYDDPINHFTKDILPWIYWGATRADPTTVEERLRAYSIDLGGGLATAQKNERKAVAIDDLSKEELASIAVFIRIIDHGSIPEVYSILRDPNYEPKEPYAIGRGITQGLLSVIAKGSIQSR